MGVAHSGLWNKLFCLSSNCLCQGWCCVTGREICPFPLLPASSYLLSELLMPLVMCVGWRLSPLLGQLQKENCYNVSYRSVNVARIMLYFYLSISLSSSPSLNKLLNFKVVCLFPSCTDHVLHFEHS